MSENQAVRDEEGYEQPEGLDGSERAGAWGDYPIDSVLVRQQPRTVFEVVRRIKQGGYVMNPEFQRDFVWPLEQQSRLIESALMRIPLPVFYLAESPEGTLIVVDGLQRLTTFHRYVDGEFALVLDNPDLRGKHFKQLSPKLQSRIEDTQLILYIIDPKVPERARLDIFERVNSGVPLTRQQMRNCLYVGPASRWLKEEASTEIFKKATGGRLNPLTMQDREVANRFCAFAVLGPDAYHGDLDDFLARALTAMNEMPPEKLHELSEHFRRGLNNNVCVFDKHAFRKHTSSDERRKPFNIALFDVFSVEMAKLEADAVQKRKDALREGFYRLMQDAEFMTSITQGTSDKRRVATRFSKVSAMLNEVMCAQGD